MIELLIVLLFTFCLIALIVWSATITSSYSNKSRWGFVSYSKFKKLYNTVTWEVRESSKYTLLRGADAWSLFDDSNELFPSGGCYCINNIALVAITPIDLFLINRFIKKEYNKICEEKGYQKAGRKRVKL